MADRNVRHIIKFYKPYDGKGSMFSAEYSMEKGCFFFSAAPEKTDVARTFNYDQKITLKIDQNDIGDLLAVLSGRKNGLGQFKNDKFGGLYHKGDSHSSFVNLDPRPAEKGGGFYLSLGRTQDSNTVKCSMGLTIAEAILLYEFIKLFLFDYFTEYNDVKPENQNNSEKKTNAKSEKAASPAKETKKAVAEEEIPF